MSSNSHSLNTSAFQVERTPWLIFLFLAAVFFFVYHDLSFSENGQDSYFPSEDLLAAGVADGSPIRRVAILALGIFAIVSLVRHRGDGWLRFNGLLGWTLFGFTAWALASPIWAEDKVMTLTRVVVLAILCLAAMAIARRFSLRDVILWTFFCTALFLAIGIASELFFGQFRPFAPGYRFAGTIHPNIEGIDCALLVLSGIAIADQGKYRRTAFRVCALFGFIFLLLTGSRTAFAATVLALAVYFASVWPKRTKIAMAYALSIGFCVFLLLLLNASLPSLKGTVMLGRDDASIDSFNGRTGIWEEIGYYVQQRPILGYGYGGFWTPRHMDEISGSEKWGVPNSHSAYLDYLLTLGAVGLLGYVFLLFAGIRRAFRFQRVFHNPAFAFCGALLVFCAFDGFLESSVVDPSLLMFLSWVVLASLAFKDNPNPNLSWSLFPDGQGVADR